MTARPNDVFIANVPKGASNAELWPHIFKLTRALKKAGWEVRASSDGTTKVVSNDPELDKFGSGVTTGVTGAAASIAAPVNGRALVTGLSSIVAGHKGMFLRITGGATSANNHYHQIEEVVSGSSVRINARVFAVASDANNGALTWTVYDPTTQTVALTGVVAWILMSGPSTIKVPITSAPTPGGSGDFSRGENIVQATTSFEGEIVGYVFAAGAGYLVVRPRVRGSGGGVFGLATGNVFTGASSGATVTQVGTAVEYRRQIVIAKAADQLAGAIYEQCIDPVGETASDFVTLASASGCTATVWPGAGGTSNGFPTLAWVLNGVGTGTTTTRSWHGANSAPTGGNGQIIAVDCIPVSGQSADGSWGCFSATISAGGGMTGYFCSIMDDGETGELDPFVSFTPLGSSIALASGNAAASRTTTNLASSGTPHDVFNGTHHAAFGVASYGFFRGTRGRGCGGAIDEYAGVALMRLQGGYASSTPLEETNVGDPMKFVTTPTTTKTRTPVNLASDRTSGKIWKGRCRHVSLVQGGSGMDTYDTGAEMQLSSTNGCFVWAPWDEATNPVAS